MPNTLRLEFASVIALLAALPGIAGAADISDCAELQVMSLSGDHTITNNIDCEGVDFAPLGNFTGTLDGGGFKITNLVVHRPSMGSVGLFSKITSTLLQLPRVSNLTLEGIKITGGFKTGGLAGAVSGTACNSSTDPENICPVVVENVHITSTPDKRSAIVGKQPVGGMVGQNFRANLYNVTVDADVSSDDPNTLEVGGLIGDFFGGFVRDGFTSGEVRGRAEVGGLVGGGSSGAGGAAGNLLRCGSTATIVGTAIDSDGLGGIVGTQYAGTIKECFASGNVTGRGKLGGLVGEAGAITISDSYARGNVTGTTSQHGGLVGRSYGPTTIDRTYATGTVSSRNGQAGGLVGDSLAVITDSYATGTVNSTFNNFVGGFVGFRRGGSVVTSNCSGLDPCNGGATFEESGDAFHAFSNHSLHDSWDQVTVWHQSSEDDACLLWEETCGSCVDTDGDGICDDDDNCPNDPDNTVNDDGVCCADVTTGAMTVVDALLVDPATPSRALKSLRSTRNRLESGERKCIAGQGTKSLNDFRRVIGTLEDAIRLGVPSGSLDPTLDGLLAFIRLQAEDEVQAAIARMGRASRIQTAQNKLARGMGRAPRSSAAKDYVTAYTKAKQS